MSKGFKGQPKEYVPSHMFVAFKPKCGHAVGGHVITVRDRKSLSDFATEAEDAGLIVEIRSVKWAQENLNICECK